MTSTPNPEPRPDGIVPPHIRDRLPKSVESPARPRKHRGGIDAAGIAAIILAAAVGVGWAASVIIITLGAAPLDEQAASLLAGIGPMIVEALVAFLAYRIGRDAGRAQLPGS